MPRIVEEGDCGTLLPLTDVEHVEEASEKAAPEERGGGIGGGGGRADDGLKWVGRLVREWGRERGRGTWVQSHHWRH